MAYKDPLDPRNREARLRHYYANKDQYLQRNREKRERLREWVSEYKARPCADCGVQYPPYVMDFDHLDPTTKKDVVGRIIMMGSWKQLLAEVEKCDVVCANCHRERTHGSERRLSRTASKTVPQGFESLLARKGNQGAS